MMARFKLLEIAANFCGRTQPTEVGEMPEPIQIPERDEEDSKVTQEDYLRDYEAMQNAVKAEIAERKRRAKESPKRLPDLEEITF